MRLSALPANTRWSLHLAILCCPLLLAMISTSVFGLPENGFQLAVFLFLEISLWVLVFTVAFRISGVTAGQLRLTDSHPLRVIGYGLLWFVVIRVAVALLLGLEAKWIDPSWLWATEEKMFSVMHAKNIPSHPEFSLILYGLVSLLAGISEELWRAGMVAGCEGLFPRLKEGGPRIFLCIVAVSLLFGLGHLYQGWLGMENALLLGICLGLILVYRDSYWEAAFIHTLFDAFSFGMVMLVMLNPHLLNPELVSGATRGSIPRVEYLLDLGVDINGPYDWRGATALSMAAYKSNPEMVSFLLEKGANPNVKDSDGETPLIIAAEKNQSAIINLLVAKGAKLNWQNERGFTALRQAVQFNRMEAARVLIDSGADLNLKDNQGETPMAAADKLGYSDLELLLEQKGAK